MVRSTIYNLESRGTTEKSNLEVNRRSEVKPSKRKMLIDAAKDKDGRSARQNLKLIEAAKIKGGVSPTALARFLEFTRFMSKKC